MRKLWLPAESAVNDAPTWSLLPGRRHEFFSHTKDPIQESNNSNLRKLGVLSKYWLAMNGNIWLCYGHAARACDKYAVLKLILTAQKIYIIAWLLHYGDHCGCFWSKTKNAQNDRSLNPITTDNNSSKWTDYPSWTEKSGVVLWISILLPDNNSSKWTDYPRKTE